MISAATRDREGSSLLIRKMSLGGDGGRVVGEMRITPACEVTKEGVTIRVLGIPKRISFSEIRSVQKATWLRAYFVASAWGKSNMSLFGVALIETNDGRRWAVSPKNRDEFIQQVSSHLTNSG